MNSNQNCKTDLENGETNPEISANILLTIVNSTPDLIWSVNARDYGLLTFNKSLSDYFLNELNTQIKPGDRPEDIFMESEKVDFWHDLYKRALREGQFTIEYPVIAEERVLELRFNVIGSEGTVKGVSVFGNDISGRKKVETALFKAEQQYKLLFETANEGIIVTQDFYLRFVNTVILDLTGYSEEFLYSVPFIDFIHPDDRELMINNYQRRISGEVIQQKYQIRIIANNNTIKWIEISGNKIEWEGRPAILNFINNITERKIFEERLKESEERYRSLFQQASDGIFNLTTEGKIIAVNESFARMHGYTIEEMLGMSLKDLDTPDCISKTPDNMRRVLAGEVIEFEVEHYHKDGHIFPLSVSTGLISTGGVQTIQAFHRDITERKKAEKALFESERKYKALFEANSDGITIFSLEGDKVPSVILDMNENAHKMLGFSKEEMIRRNPAEMEKNVTPEKIIQRAEELKRNGFTTFETELGHKNGHYISVEIKVLILNYDNQLALMNIVRDITERKHAEIELIKAKEKAEESDKLKSAFLANMSHEIRTPMNGILGFSSLLNDDGYSGEDYKRFVQMIQKSGSRMLNIINEIVDISKIESGTMESHVEDTNVNEKIQFIYNLMKPEADEKHLRFSMENSLPDHEAIIKTDIGKLYSVLTNLVKNAIKYTDEGYIEFGYTLKPSVSSDKSNTLESIHHADSFLEFYVKDSGIGIPSHRQKVIFDRFIQADITDLQAREGAGLGLAIAKSYVEMLGGKIWVESSQGSGSSFYFTLPYSREVVKDKMSKIPNHQPTPKLSSEKLVILIVEDDETSANYLSRIVMPLADNILYATSGIEAISICHSNPEINIILMDIRMPDMNGYKATQEIRTFNKDVIIIAQTAFSMEGDRLKSLQAGCNDYISKPINKEDLRELIKVYSRPGVSPDGFEPSTQ